MLAGGVISPRPPIWQTRRHSASVTGWTDRRGSLARAMPARRLSALIRSRPTGVGSGSTAATSTARQAESVESGGASAITSCRRSHAPCRCGRWNAPVSRPPEAVAPPVDLSARGWPEVDFNGLRFWPGWLCVAPAAAIIAGVHLTPPWFRPQPSLVRACANNEMTMKRETTDPLIGGATGKPSNPSRRLLSALPRRQGLRAGGRTLSTSSTTTAALGCPGDRPGGAGVRGRLTPESVGVRDGALEQCHWPCFRERSEGNG